MMIIGILYQRVMENKVQVLVYLKYHNLLRKHSHEAICSHIRHLHLCMHRWQLDHQANFQNNSFSHKLQHRYCQECSLIQIIIMNNLQCLIKDNSNSLDQEQVIHGDRMLLLYLQSIHYLQLIHKCIHNSNNNQHLFHKQPTLTYKFLFRLVISIQDNKCKFCSMVQKQLE